MADQPYFVWVELPCGHQMYERSDIGPYSDHGVRLPCWPCETCGARDERIWEMWIDDGTGPRRLADLDD